MRFFKRLIVKQFVFDSTDMAWCFIATVSKQDDPNQCSPFSWLQDNLQMEEVRVIALCYVGSLHYAIDDHNVGKNPALAKGTHY